jgi:tRNA threonylcarbamoyladenosine dehydratase
VSQDQSQMSEKDSLPHTEKPAGPGHQKIDPMTPTELENYTLHRRFDRMGRLVGDHNMNRLLNSNVMVIGLGGVGSWAAESLVRSGIGEITLVDFDEICITNFNRQLHALQGLVGKDKAWVMAERMQKINPQLKVNVFQKFYNADHCAEIFSRRPDYVVDAIDHMTSKAHLLNFCRNEKIPVVSSTGSGGRMDPTQIKVADLSQTERDPLARELRRILREEYQFPRQENTLFGIPAVYSIEPHTAPLDLNYDGGKGFRCVCPQGDNPYFTCDNRNLILGNSSFVTGTFGLVCASWVVRDLIGQSPVLK